MKTAVYTDLNGKKFSIEYDETAPCIMCGLPVTEASMGGTVLCPWCDCGWFRNGELFTIEECMSSELVKAKARRLMDKKR